MDKEFTSEEGTKISNRAWQDTAPEIISSLTKYPCLKVFHINTSLGFVCSNNTFTYYKSINEAKNKLKYAWNSFVPITVFGRRTLERGLVFGLEQRLPGKKIKKEEANNIFKKHSFEYKWYKNREGVLIRKYLATLEPNQILNQAKLLLKEAELFHFSYIQEDNINIDEEIEKDVGKIF